MQGDERGVVGLKAQREWRGSQCMVRFLVGGRRGANKSSSGATTCNRAQQPRRRDRMYFVFPAWREKLGALGYTRIDYSHIDAAARVSCSIRHPPPANVNRVGWASIAVLPGPDLCVTASLIHLRQPHCGFLTLQHLDDSCSLPIRVIVHG